MSKPRLSFPFWLCFWIVVAVLLWGVANTIFSP